MKLTVEYMYDEIVDGLNRALPSLIIAMFMMVIAFLTSNESDVVTNLAMGSSICFAALSAFLIWGPIHKTKSHFWRNLAVIFFGTGFLLFILAILAFYYEIFFD